MKRILLLVLLSVPLLGVAQESRSTLKGYFETGDIPTQTQFESLIDSQWNLADDGDLDSTIVYDSLADHRTLLDAHADSINDLRSDIGSGGGDYWPLSGDFPTSGEQTISAGGLFNLNYAGRQLRLDGTRVRISTTSGGYGFDVTDNTVRVLAGSNRLFYAINGTSLEIGSGLSAVNGPKLLFNSTYPNILQLRNATDVDVDSLGYGFFTVNSGTFQDDGSILWLNSSDASLLDISGNYINLRLASPFENEHAATKSYVDTGDAAVEQLVINLQRQIQILQLVIYVIGLLIISYLVNRFLPKKLPKLNPSIYKIKINV